MQPVSDHERLKRRAKCIKKKYGLRHGVALDVIAGHLGYASWMALTVASKRDGVALPMVRTEEGKLRPWSFQFDSRTLPATFAELYAALNQSRQHFVYLD